MTTTSKRSGPPTSSNYGFILVVVGIIVLGLLAVAVLATNRGGDSVAVTEEQTAAVEIDGAGLTVMPEGVNIGTAANDPAVGLTAPSLTATDFEGKEITIGADGRPKAVYFLAHWCPHCQAEVGLVQELIDNGGLPDGLDLYAVSTAVDEGRGNYPPQSWLLDEGFEPITVRDDGASSAFTAFGGSGFPYVVYLDGENRLLARSAGQLDAETITNLWVETAASGSS